MRNRLIFTLHSVQYLLGEATWALAALLISCNVHAQNLFMATGANNIAEFTSSGRESTFAPGVLAPNALAFNSAGILFTESYTNGSSWNIIEITPNGSESIFTTQFHGDGWLVFDGADNLFTTTGTSIVEISTNGVPSTFATGLNDPQGMAFDGAGNLFTTSGTSIVEIPTNGVPSTFATGIVYPYGLAFNSAGSLFVADAHTGNIYEFTNSNGILSSNQTVYASGMNWPIGIAFDRLGNLFVANQNGGNIIKVATNGVQQVFASGFISPQGLAFQPSPNLMATGAGIQTNQFGFTLVGDNNQVVYVDACTNLANPVWTLVSTNTLIGGSSYFIEPQWMNYASRFYRISSP
jgi:hypothetical protein